jgi:hypothetical protein
LYIHISDRARSSYGADAQIGTIAPAPYPPLASTSRLPPNPTPLSFAYASSSRSYTLQHGAAGAAKHGHVPSGGSSGSAKALQGTTGASGEVERGHRRASVQSDTETLSVQVGEDAYFLRTVRHTQFQVPDSGSPSCRTRSAWRTAWEVGPEGPMPILPSFLARSCTVRAALSARLGLAT